MVGWISPDGVVITGTTHREMMNTHPLMTEDPFRQRANQRAAENQDAITKMWLSPQNRQDIRERAEWQLNDNLYDVYYVGGWLRLVFGYENLTIEGLRSTWNKNHRVAKALAVERQLKPHFHERESQLIDRVQGL